MPSKQVATDRHVAALKRAERPYEIVIDGSRGLCVQNEQAEEAEGRADDHRHYRGGSRYDDPAVVDFRHGFLLCLPRCCVPKLSVAAS